MCPGLDLWWGNWNWVEHIHQQFFERNLTLQWMHAQSLTWQVNIGRPINNQWTLPILHPTILSGWNATIQQYRGPWALNFLEQLLLSVPWRIRKWAFLCLYTWDSNTGPYSPVRLVGIYLTTFLEHQLRAHYTLAGYVWTNLIIIHNAHTLRNVPLMKFLTLWAVRSRMMGVV